MTADEYRAYLRQRIAKAGGLREFARQIEVTPGQLCAVTKGREPPPPSIMRATGHKWDIIKA